MKSSQITSLRLLDCELFPLATETHRALTLAHSRGEENTLLTYDIHPLVAEQ